MDQPLLTLPDRPPEGLLIFLHIPKTAGTTLSRIIRIKLGLWPPSNLMNHSLTFGYYQINPIEARLAHIQSLPEARQRRIKLFQGHFGFGVHKQLPSPAYHITILRDPVERVISAYYQLRRGREEDCLAKDLTLDEFVTCGRDFGRFHADNGQVRSLTGTDGNPNKKPFNGLTNEDLEQARHNIREHFAFVGLSERFDESALLMKQILGWQHCHYASTNIAPNRKKREEFSESTLDLIREYNRLDIALYEEVSRAFDDLIARQGERFQEELAKFQASNARYSRLAGPMIDLLPGAKRLGQKLRVVR